MLLLYKIIRKKAFKSEMKTISNIQYPTSNIFLIVALCYVRNYIRILVALKFGIVLLITFITCSLSAQNAYVKGTVSDSGSSEKLAGASVVNSKKTGVVTDSKGEYLLKITVTDTLTFSFLGYHEYVKTVNVKSNDTLVLNVVLKQKSEKLSEVVVSEGKYEQKISEVTVSMNIIKPYLIENNNETNLESVLTKIPGIEIMDGQPSIRGGSGYSYGAGSRVLLLLNDLPLLSADAGDIKWNFLPLENVAQIEIIKGASSVLFGSSALNGVVNFRTAFAKSVPETKSSIIAGFYLKPERKELIWWESPRFYYGINCLHSQKIKNSDIIISGDYFNDKGYRENEYEKRARFNLNYLHRDSGIKGLSYGVNSILMNLDKIDFFIWQDADSGAYKQNVDAISELSGVRLSVDPFINYYTLNGIKHNLKSRYFYVNNSYKTDTGKNSTAQSLFIEYKFFKKFANKLNLVTGFSEKISNIKAELYDNHQSNELSFYAQLNKQFLSRLKILFGFRVEQFFLDGKKENFQPIFRSGLNYQLFEYTFLRASFGQGYRYPSIAEKYTSVSVGSLNILPNPDLKPEKGWSAEAAIMQNFEINNLLMNFDIAVFVSRYRNMMEFKYDLHLPPGISPSSEYLGFKAFNVNNTRITGIDLSWKASRNFGDLAVQFQTGYTTTKPINMDYDNDSIKNGEILKYRHLNIFKSDIEFAFNKVSFGVYFSHHSKMINIDSVFLEPIIGTIMILPGFDTYWETYNKPFAILDFRFVFKVSTISTFTLNLKNALNKEYMIRPGDIGPPRSLSLKYSLKI